MIKLGRKFIFNFGPIDLHEICLSLSCVQSEELDKTSNPTIWHVNGGWNQRFRVCNGCLSKIKQELSAIDFNDSLTRLQAELVDLQEQIAAVLDDVRSKNISDWPDFLFVS